MSERPGSAVERSLLMSIAGVLAAASCYIGVVLWEDARESRLRDVVERCHLRSASLLTDDVAVLTALGADHVHRGTASGETQIGSVASVHVDPSRMPAVLQAVRTNLEEVERMQQRLDSLEFDRALGRLRERLDRLESTEVGSPDGDASRVEAVVIAARQLRRMHSVAADRALSELTRLVVERRWVLGVGGAALAVIVASIILATLRGLRAGSVREAHLHDELEESHGQLAQSQKMEALGTLAGGVAHDFNNLLLVIMGHAELARAGIAGEDPAHESLIEVERAAARAADLTRQLLAFSRREVGERRSVDIGQTVSQLDGMLRRLIGNDVELVTRVSAENGRVLADPGQLEQVIVNLVVNARDAMPDGGTVMVEVADEAEEKRSQRSESEPGRVRLSVADTGEGIPESMRDRIFEPFFTTKPSGLGTGLGLSMVHGIVTKLGGSIQVDSDVGIGTRFDLFLPNTEESEKATEQAASPSAAGGSEAILVVEDQQAVRSFVAESLRGGGYTVLEAEGGGEALALCEAHDEPIDLILTDVVMPGMNGMDLARRVETLRPEARLIFMSGHSDDPRLGKIQQSLLLRKPFRSTELLNRVRRCLDEEPPGVLPSFRR